MNILVCISHVPDTTAKIAFDAEGKALDSTGIQYIIGPYDDYALARAVELKTEHSGSITVLNVGEADTEPSLRKALAIGADKGVRINAVPSDSLFVARQIADFASKHSFDMILMGRESIDFNGGVVHAMVGELLGMPSVSPVMELTIEDSRAQMTREIEGGKERLSVPLPMVAGCQEPIAEWKIPNMRGIMMARKKPLDVIEPVDSPKVVNTIRFENMPAKSEVKLVEQDNLDELIDLLKNEAKVI